MITVDKHGNTSAASIPLALDAAKRDGRIKQGDLVMIEAIGGGFTLGIGPDPLVTRRESHRCHTCPSCGSGVGPQTFRAAAWRFHPLTMTIGLLASKIRQRQDNRPKRRGR